MVLTESPQRSVPRELYKTPPPPFGRGMLSLFGFDRNYVNLNNGSYGALPLPVRDFCDTLTDEVESNPDKFIALTNRVEANPNKLIWINYTHYLNLARERVAKFIDAETDECVIVTNASLGIATILRNFTYNEGDILLGATTTRGSVSQTLKYLADLPPHPTISTFNLQFPTTHEKIVRDFEGHVKQLTKTGDVIGKRRIIAIIDTVASNPGVLLPWKEMVSICREAGVISVVDGAHSIGQELDINLSEVWPDFWISDCHKWLFAKRGSAVLYVPKRNQHIIRSPMTTQFTYKSPHDNNYKGLQDFVKLFECADRNDRFRPVAEHQCGARFQGGEHKINEYTHLLAIEGGKRLAEHLGTSVLDPDGEFTLNMVNVELPIPGDVEPSKEIDQIFMDTLFLEWNTFVPTFKHNGKWWARCSAQIWNEVSDFDLVADALKDACARVGRFVAQ